MQNAKSDLYAFVAHLRSKWGVPSHTPLNTQSICSEIMGAEIIQHPFETIGLGGAAFIGKYSDTVVLNSNRTPLERNFDCGHELIHLTKHRSLNGGVFNCFEQEQNSFLEWQANEGAAELLVPYKDFIPRFVWCLLALSSGYPFSVQDTLARHYCVTSRVISVRMDSLAFEIDQYRRGTPIDQISLLSKSERKKHGIQTTCYEAKCAFPMGWNDYIG